MTFIGFVFKNLTRRPFRTGLTLTALATAIGSVMSLLGVADGFTESFRGVYESHRVDVVVSREGSADRLSSSLDDTFPEKIRLVSQVDRATGVLLETLSVEDRQIYGIPSMGMRTDSWLFADYEMKEVSASTQDESSIVYLGRNLAERLKASVGDQLALFDEPFEVAGIFDSPSIWENGSMILPLASLQDLTGREQQLTYINVVLKSDTRAEAIPNVVQQIESLDAKLLALPTDEFVDSDTRMQMAGAMAWMTSVIALIVGIIGTLNTMMTSVLERTTEIGILRAIGWPVRRIAGVIFCESVVLALLASALGGIGAAALLSVLASSETTGGLLQPSLAIDVWIRGGLIGLGIGVLGALLPTYRATQMQPTDALRQQT